MLWVLVAASVVRAATPMESPVLPPLALGDTPVRVASIGRLDPLADLGIATNSQTAHEIPSLGSALVFTIAGAFLTVTGVGGGAAGGILLGYAHSYDSGQQTAGWIIAGAGALFFLAGVPLLVIGLREFSQRTEVVAAGVTFDPGARSALFRVALRV